MSPLGPCEAERAGWTVSSGGEWLDADTRLAGAHLTHHPPPLSQPFRALPSGRPLVVLPERQTGARAGVARRFDVASLQRALQPTQPLGHAEQAFRPADQAGRSNTASQSNGWQSEYHPTPVNQQQDVHHALHESWNSVRQTRPLATVQQSQPNWALPGQYAPQWEQGAFAPRMKQPQIPWTQQQMVPAPMPMPVTAHSQQPAWPAEETYTRASTPSWPSVSYPPELATLENGTETMQAGDSGLAETARAILANDAVQEDRETDPAGAREFFSLMERLANGDTLDEDVQDNLAYRDGRPEEVVQDPYMPGVAQPRFAADGSLVRSHSPLRSMAPRPAWLASSETQPSSWTSAFEEAESHFAEPQLGKGKGRQSRPDQRGGGMAAYSVPGNIKEALASSAAISSAIAGTTSAWEEEIDYGQDLFADFYGRDRWRPSEAKADLQTEAAERWRAMTGLAVPGIARDGHEQVEAVQRANHGISDSEGRRAMQENEDLLDYLERAKTWREDEGSGYVRGRSAEGGRLYMFQKDNPYLADQQTARFADMAGEGALLADEQEYKVNRGLLWISGPKLTLLLAYRTCWKAKLLYWPSPKMLAHGLNSASSSRRMSGTTRPSARFCNRFRWIRRTARHTWHLPCRIATTENSSRPTTSLRPGSISL